MLVYSVHSLAPSSERWYFKRIHNTVWFLLLFSLLTIDSIKKECSWDGDSVFSVSMFFYKYVDYWSLAPVKRNIHKNFTTFKWRYTASCLLWNITGFSEIVIHSFDFKRIHLSTQSAHIQICKICNEVVSDLNHFFISQKG